MGKMTIQQILMQLAGGMGTSIQIFAVTLIFSLPLGLFVALGRMSKNKLLQAVIKVYISIMRGTPLMLQLLVVYFGPYYIFGMRVGCLLYTSESKRTLRTVCTADEGPVLTGKGGQLELAAAAVYGEKRCL